LEHGGIVIVYQNAMCKSMELSLQIDGKNLSAVLPQDSINTLLISLTAV